MATVAVSASYIVGSSHLVRYPQFSFDFVFCFRFFQMQVLQRLSGAFALHSIAPCIRVYSDRWCIHNLIVGIKWMGFGM